MSRPQKIVPPIKGTFTDILTSIAIGSGKGRRAAKKLAQNPIIKATDKTPKK
jgi:hypothetical protein